MGQGEQPGASRGLAMAIVAYGLWGLFPIYWKQLASVPAPEVLAHRVLWALVFAALLLLARRSLGRALRLLAEPAKRRAMLLSAGLIAANWGLFIWAVSVDRVTEASLGYYINPLLNVVLARLVLGERLRPFQAVAVGVAASGVIYLTLSRGELPWVSLVLATTFSLYGLVRKRAPIGPVDGLAIETGLVTPFAIGYLLLLDPPLGRFAASADLGLIALLVGSGVATSVPLLAFADAARRLRYTTLGMVQYLAPTLQLACAVLLYGEPFRREHAITFGLIWCAVAIYLGDAVLRRRPLPAPA
jgi:chloramphenicol-sensitive protein RarD